MNDESRQRMSLLGDQKIISLGVVAISVIVAVIVTIPYIVSAAHDVANQIG